jgi:N-carbamoyl-L-amino-acid hydrolase
MSRGFFTQQAQAAGLDVTTDTAANLLVQLPADDPNFKTLLLGSHLDTVPNGGPYDGALGIIAALEVLRVVKENDLSLPVHLEAIAFTDEEGRFGDFFGSLALTGKHTSETIETFLTHANEFAADLSEMQNIVPGNLTPQSILSARRNPDTLAGYVELHIEQGPRLEQADVPIGVVDAIFGRRTMQITFKGRADHAGTTPLNLRADALLTASRFITQADRLVRENYPGAVITCGNVGAKPGVYNVVPNEATVLVEFRTTHGDTLEDIYQSLHELSSNLTTPPNLSFSIEQVDNLEPVNMDAKIQRAIRQASEELGYRHFSLSSGAAHDAQAFATITPTGMIFVPSIAGRSHCPEEETAEMDLVAGANVLLQTALKLADAKF